MVLIITGFIVAILLQSLQQVFRLQTHFGREIFHTQNGAMYADWFRQSINGLIPDDEGGKQRFSGEQRQISGLTISPLEQENGTPAPCLWRLEFDPLSGLTGLFFGASGDKRELQILAWSGNSGRFVYVDAQDGTHDNWPPFLGKWPQLPSAIYLESGPPEQIRIIVAAPRGTAIPPLRRKDSETR